MKATATRRALWLGLAALACAGGLILPGLREMEQALHADPLVASANPYRFVAADGRTVPRTLLGVRPTAWIFGYSRCGAPCLALLDRVDELASRLGADASKINFVFVTLDPVQDTPEVLHRYLSGHTPRLVALIGPQMTTQHMAQYMANRFRVSYAQGRPAGPFPGFADLTRIFLTDRTGKLIEAVELDEPLDTGIAELRQAMGSEDGTSSDGN